MSSEILRLQEAVRTAQTSDAMAEAIVNLQSHFSHWSEPSARKALSVALLNSQAAKFFEKESY